MTLDEFTQAKGFPQGSLAQYGVIERDGEIVIQHYTTDGSLYGRSQLRNHSGDGQGFRWEKSDLPVIPYGLQKPVPYSRGTVWIVEGASDCWACWLAGVPALGLPGASTAGSLLLEHLEGVQRVAIVREPGDAGSRFPHKVALRLYDLGFAGECYSVILPEKDPRALFNKHPGNFRERLVEAYGFRQLIERPRGIKPLEDGLLTFEQLSRKAQEHTKWIIEGMLRESGLMLIAGRPKAGKSYLAANLAISVAGNRSFLGRQCEQGSVLWVGLEDPIAETVDRFEMLDAEGLPIFFKTGDGFPIDQRDAWLRQIVDGHRPSMVIIDTIGRFANIEDVNDYTAVTRATQVFLDLRNQFGTSFVLLHHNNASDKVLGSTMWQGVVDTILSVTTNDEDIRFVKSVQRSGVSTEPIAITLDQETGRIIGMESKFMADVRVAEMHIKDFLETVEDATKEDIYRRAGRRGSVARTAIDSMASRGDLLVSGTGLRDDPRRYALAVKMPREDAQALLDYAQEILL